MTDVFLLPDAHQSGSFIISEAEGFRSRDRVTMRGGAGEFGFGTVIGRSDIDGKYVPTPAVATDGSDTALAILWEDTDASAADTLAGVVARAAEVYAGALTYDASVTTSAQQQAKWAQLANVGIIVREQDDPSARAVSQLHRLMGW